MNAPHDFPIGLRYCMPINEYHSSPAISNSGLGDFARSPFHYHALHLNPQRPREQQTDAQRHGVLAHCAILEPDEFPKRYATGPIDDRRLKAWKEWEASLPTGLEAIKPSEHAFAFAQAASARAHPEIARILSVGLPEVSAFWIDAETGVQCRCRPDWVHPLEDGRVILADVKTYASASAAEFARQVDRMAYHRQAAWYSRGYEIASGIDVAAFIFIAIEDKWPFAARPFMLDDESLQCGRDENRALLGRFAQCQRTDTWPGYGDGVELISLRRRTTQPINEEETA